NAARLPLVGPGAKFDPSPFRSRSMSLPRPLARTLRAASFLVAATFVAGTALDAQLPTRTDASTASASTDGGARALRTLGLEDLLSWKSIRFPTFSNDGRWMAYVLAPNEGDAEFVVRATTEGAAETRIPIGEAPSGFGGAAGVAISGNNRW